jgi:hypothetical protein
MVRVLIVFSLVCLLVVSVCLYVVESGEKQVTMSIRWVSSSSWEIVGSPTVSVEQIERVLEWCQSPAVGKGQALYDEGVRYGIDPVFPLAFFLHESTCGTKGMAAMTHSLGNLRCIAGHTCINTRGQVCQPGQSCYAYFSSWEDSFESWYRLLKYQYIARGLVTVDRIIPVYAPAGDSNDVQAYICAIKSAVTAWRNGQVAVLSGREC